MNTVSDSDEHEGGASASGAGSGCAPLRSITALAWIVFGVALVVFLVESRHLTKPGYDTLRDRSFLLSGDEPWYLLNTRSVAMDLDYNLYNDRVEQEFWDKNISGWTLEKELRAIGHGRTKTEEYWAERVYPTKQIGLGIVLAPAYRVGLLWDEQVRLTCVWFLCLVGAFLVQQVFWLGYELTSSRAAAAVGALAGAFSMPMIVYAAQIFTELVAAFLLIVAVRMVLTSKWPPVVRAIITGCCLAYLPWLHEKYYLFVLVGIVMFCVASRPWRWKPLVGFGVPLVVSAVLLMMFYRTIYGVPYPVYVHKDPISVAAGFRSGYLGLLFDRTDGLLPFWPMLAFAVVGLVWMCRDRERRRVGVWLAVLTGALWLVYGAFPDWPGGVCPPLRYWLPVVPLLIVASSYALAAMRQGLVVMLAVLALLLGVVVGVRGMSHPRALMKDSVPMAPGPGTLGSRTIERTYHAFPDMKRRPDGSGPSARDYVRGVVWLVVLSGFVVLVVRLERRREGGAETPEVEQDDRATDSIVE